MTNYAAVAAGAYQRRSAARKKTKDIVHESFHSSTVSAVTSALSVVTAFGFQVMTAGFLYPTLQLLSILSGAASSGTGCFGTHFFSTQAGCFSDHSDSFSVHVGCFSVHLASDQ